MVSLKFLSSSEGTPEGERKAMRGEVKSKQVWKKRRVEAEVEEMVSLSSSEAVPMVM